jgi:hypothetical protein
MVLDTKPTAHQSEKLVEARWHGYKLNRANELHTIYLEPKVTEIGATVDIHGGKR